MIRLLIPKPPKEGSSVEGRSIGVVAVNIWGYIFSIIFKITGNGSLEIA
jgi:hypothetical protein